MEASCWVRRCWCCCGEDEEAVARSRAQEEQVEEVYLRRSRSSLSLPPQVCPPPEGPSPGS